MNPSQLVLLGFGTVCKTMMTLMNIINPGLIEKLPILIIEPKDLSQSDIFQKLTKMCPHLQVLTKKLTKTNYREIFSQLILENAIVVDLAYRIDTACVIQECQQKHCLYINTAIDNWEHSDKSIFSVKTAILKSVKYPAGEPHMTAALNHGMNPGLVSHFVKSLLKILAERSGKSQFLPYNQLARDLGLTLIQIAERDNQQTKFMSSETAFFNTWSVIGFVDEALLPTEISWGTHEQVIPYGANTSVLEKSSQIILPIPGYQVRTRSYEPKGGEFTGYCIPHAECYSLANFLRVDKDKKSGEEAYHPSVYYSYLIPDTAKLMTHYMEYCLDKNYLPQNEHVLRSDEILGGYDSVGCLLFFRQPDQTLKKYWIGTIVTNQMARKISPEINGTCLQVAISVLSCIDWMIANPHMGIIEPESVDSEFILNHCRKWLGYYGYKDVTKSCEIETDQLSQLLSMPSDILF